MVQVQEFGTSTRQEFEFLHQCGKKVKIKARKFWSLIFTSAEVTKGKLVGEGATGHLPSPILNAVDFQLGNMVKKLKIFFAEGFLTILDER